LFTAAIAWFFALPAWLWARWIRRNEAPLADALAFAALWVMQEAFRGWFLTGFPWLVLRLQPTRRSAGRARAAGRHVADFVCPGLSAALLCNLPRLIRAKRKAFIAAGRAAGRPWIIGRPSSTTPGPALRVIR
jgi:apolipoprotein N-acyltransferase